jgi:NCS1 nucleoside transporter family
MEQLPGEIKDSPLYSEELAPVPAGQRTWNTRHLAALWVGMAVCIPTWVLASYMLKAGLNWVEALFIIGLANIVITLPMVLNGFAGVKYGLSFPVIGRSAFGIHGIHLASLLRGLVACGWFGVQTWIGGLAISVILGLIFGIPYREGVNLMNFIGFGLFWLISLGFIVKGFEGIKWLEEYAAPLLILVGIALIGWGVYAGGGFAPVLDKSGQLQYNSAERILENGVDRIVFQPLERPGTDITKAHMQNFGLTHKRAFNAFLYRKAGK